MIKEFKINKSLSSGYIMQNKSIVNNNFIIYDLNPLSFAFDYSITKTERKQFIALIRRELKGGLIK